jgi:uncharacterized protein with beta-barrel porin domain
MSMRRLFRFSGALLAPASAFLVSPAAAQDMTTSTSYGENYDDEEIYEYGQGSTTYNVNVTAQIGPDQVPLVGLSRYFESYSPEEVAQAVPAGLDYDYNGATVSVVGWSAPEHVDSTYDLVDVFSYDQYTTNVLTTTTVQTTSGDGADPVVPIGGRGQCFDSGTTGDTNFCDFAGTFANCEYADDYLTVAPGTINTNTHTTTIYQNIAYHFTSVDDAYTDSYQVHPTATVTTSSGTLDTTTLTFSHVRNDAYQVNFAGRLGDQTIFSQTVAGRVSDPAAKQALADLSRPIGYALAGAPVVLVWSDPARTGSGSELLSSTSENTTTTTSDVLTTVTTTHGGLPGSVVMIGDRGACTDAGASGTTSGPSADGAQATCEGGLAYGLFPDETNTNTHTTYVTTTNQFTLVTENWLNTEDWQLDATPIPVGAVHAAVRGPLYRDGSAFARCHLDGLASSGRPFSVWADVSTGTNTLVGDLARPGSHGTTHSVAGGLSLGLGQLARAGVAIEHDSSSLRLAVFPESAHVRLTQLGAAGEVSPGTWRFRLAAAHGWAAIRTTRGNDALGGKSQAAYRAATWSLSADAGPEFGLGAATVRPVAGIDWSEATLKAFGEQGGIALGGARDSASRTAVSAGVQTSIRLGVPRSATFRLWADTRANRVLDGSGRNRAVFFAANPNAILHVASAGEPRTFGELRGGLAIETASGVGLRLGAETLVGDRTGGWRGRAGLSAAF